MITRRSFYFLRHGQTDYNAGLITGSGEFDLPLNDCGRLQAMLVRSKIKSLPIQTICHSPLKRTKETAELAAADFSLPYIEIEGLRECSNDIWTEMDTLIHGPSNCPHVQAFLSQTASGVNEALQQQETVLIVAHGGIHWALCYHLKPSGHNWDLSNAGLVYFEPRGEADWYAELLHCNHPVAAASKTLV